MEGSLSRRFAAAVSDKTKVFGAGGRFFKSAPRRASQSAEHFFPSGVFFGSFLQGKKEHPQGRFSGGETAPVSHLLAGGKFSPEKAAQNLPNAVICVKIALKRS
ncbi:MULTISPECIES: hypothetical protein [Anaerotruncus]|uniref:hypothetical protein n=1 Tax=Anaerotruncus TaxID=244127 RepID=UPI0023EF7C1A|nr:hypothetical protein [Anaerotruncus massiliensis (ex Togo et al. 2019)]